MFNTAIHATLTRIVEPVARSMELDLWGIEVIHGDRSIVRVYVDGPHGVSVEQCADISRHTGLALEVEDVFSRPYVLEVSSPGLGRTFFRPEQLQPYIGQEIEVSLFEAPVSDSLNPDAAALFAGRKRYKGRLCAVEDAHFTFAPESVALSAPDAESAPDCAPEKVCPVLRVAWDAVRKAALVPVYPEKGEKKSLSPKSAKASLAGGNE